MYALATSIITVTRGLTTDPVTGDQVPANTVVYQGIASITETSNKFFDQASQTPRTVRALDMAVSSAADVQTGDYVLDTTFNIKYVVQDVVRGFGPMIVGDTSCGLKRVN